ncbi:5-oxoprolinase subunit PxpB [Mesorhizobium sp. WSM4887]|uniref:5-oxoprolinase subunit PxpB n=1 Tax=Mesorhizobium sp. WSM4887 TaxID=3038543 RepID=UPI002417CF7D|nr:5-oxoprolinase subunit PxpB [Mesorhizobium sp. WSM4887]MDG4889803.1 5-oxoprolinase subunit PxpB [Mesorhizobium sp. WSM4887]
MEMPKRNFRFLDAAEGGLVVEFGSTIDGKTNAAVMTLAETLGEAKLRGVLEVIPTYRSLFVQFDPLQLSKSELKEAVTSMWGAPKVPDRHGSLWHIPVCYGGDHGIDLSFVARTHGIDEAEVVTRHAAVTYRIYMIGFAPGFAYLGGLDPLLHTSRRTEPRLKTPPRSISVGGMQTAVSPPLEIPSGWHMLGRTAVRTYDPARQSGAFLFEPGDYLRFHPVTQGEYDRQLQAAEAGEPVAEREDHRD